MKINQKKIQTGTPDNGKRYKAWDQHPFIDDYLFYSYIKRKDGSQYERWISKKDYAIRKEYEENYKKENRDKINKSSRKYYQKNKQYYSEYGKKWKMDNKDKCREYARKTYHKYPDKSKLTSYANRFNNISLTKEQKELIKEIYYIRAELDLCSLGAGSTTKYHVDHIMPLNHNKFTGLHAPWNLQILTVRENCQKRNIDNNLG